MPPTLHAYYPGRSFPALSVTGGRCELQCDHCRGRYLRGMVPILTPSELVARARDLHRSGATGFLLSGGCDPRGRVPVLPYAPAIRAVKEETALLVNIHAGFLDSEEAAELVGVGVDCFSVDVVQDETVMRSVLHLDVSPAEYGRTLDALSEAGARIVPHVCVGLQSEEGESASLELISRYDVGALVVLVLMPTTGTPLASASIGPERVVRFVERAVGVLRCPVILGCMRPRGDWALERRCVEVGIDGLVSPSSRTLGWASDSGYRVERIPACCACPHR